MVNQFAVHGCPGFYVTRQGSLRVGKRERCIESSMKLWVHDKGKLQRLGGSCNVTLIDKE
jgi:hypothetical protein